MPSSLETGPSCPPAALRDPDRFAGLCSAAVCAASGVSPAEIATRARGRAKIARARHLAIYLQHVAFGATFSSCGRMFRRDRTSVRHACARIEDARDQPRFDHAVSYLEGALLSQRDMLFEAASSFTSKYIGDKS